jgi:hypothetical protein
MGLKGVLKMVHLRRSVLAVVLFVLVLLPIAAGAQESTAIPTRIPSPTSTGTPTVTITPVPNSVFWTPSPTVPGVPLDDRGRLNYGDFDTAALAGMPISYYFDGQAGDFVYILLSGNYVDATLELMQPDGIYLASTNSSPSGAGLEIIVPALPQNGRYTIRIITAYGGVTYNLSLNRVSVQSIAYGETVQGQFNGDTQVIGYRFTGEEGDLVDISLFYQGIIGVVSLHPALDPTTFLQGSDYGNSVNTRIRSYSLRAADDYLILMRSTDPTTSGEFRLHLANPTYTPLAYGDIVEATLSDAQLLLHYQFQGEIGDVIRAEVNSDGLDTLLHLFDPTGSNLISDDDSADGHDPEIPPFILTQQGTYTILVAPFNRDQTGAISLSLQRDDSSSLDDGAQELEITPKRSHVVAHFSGHADETVRLTVSVQPSNRNAPNLSISQNGVLLASPSASGVSTFAVELTIPEDGRVVIQVIDPNYSYTNITLSLERLTG